MTKEKEKEKEKIVELLKSLAIDDVVRERMLKEPVKVLKEYGIEFDENNIPDQVILPEKDDLAKSMDSYVKELSESKPFTPNVFHLR